MGVVDLSEGFLDLLGIIAKRISLREVGHSACPYHSHVLGCTCTTPEGQKNEVIVMRLSIPWHSKTCSDLIAIPGSAAINVGESDRVVRDFVGLILVEELSDRESLEGEDQKCKHSDFEHANNITKDY